MTTLTEKQAAKMAKFPLKPAPSNPEPRRNPYTGVTHTLEPQACALHDFIVQAEGIVKPGYPIPSHVRYNGTTVTKRQWDYARYLFLELWPELYYDLID